MTTTKRRINITLPLHIEKVLTELAKRDRIPEATKVARLVEVALELEEDVIWDKIAQKRDTKSARFITHEKAWK